jgi:multiple sugar transport system permease protein
MLNSHFGVFNYLLRLIGIAGPLWLDDPRWSMAGIILMTLWKIVGYNMIIFLAGLKNIPAEYYQAADIDGAGFGTRFFRITLPLLSPTTFFVIIVSLISSFLVFEQTYVMTSGGPANATLTFALYIFNNAFLYFKMGYASALAFIFFLIILAFTVMQISYQRKWVFYS